MKTRLLIIIGIVIFTVSTISLFLTYNQENSFQYPSPGMGMHTSNNPDLELIDTLVEFGCNELAINYLLESSNLLREDYDGTYVQNFIGLPDGLSEEDYDKCVQIATSIRKGNYTTTPEPEPIPFLNTGYEFCVENKKECYWIECNDNEIYHRGICMTLETKEKSESIGELENEN